jgi:hypothetical protein
MKKITVRAAALSAALSAILSLGTPALAFAQGQDFYIMQYNSTVRDLNKVIDRINTLKTDMKTEKDFTRGCSMLGSLAYELSQAQILTENMADYAWRAGDDNGHRLAVDQHNAYLEERHYWEGERSRICS